MWYDSPPEQTAGIAVIRVPQNPSLSLLEQLVRQFLAALTQTQISHQLWIIEVGRLRCAYIKPINLIILW